MTRLVVCCDGTWNTTEQMSGGLPDPTNVVRFYNMVSDGPDQKRYYHPGVGSEGGLLERVVAGAFGKGLDSNIMSAYGWLARHYAPGDDIYVVGFSRGAYTVRSLCGMIACCGLLQGGAMDDRPFWAAVNAAYDRGYRGKDATWSTGHAMHAPVPIRFVGVWDTVGALGVPDELSVLNLLDRPSRYRFHDTALSPTVQTARHAVAIDEQRAAYAPTLWTDAPSGADVKQLWFPGCHSDVGGGYLERGLGDAALDWMVREAAACGLEFGERLCTQVKPDPQGVLHDSTLGVFAAARVEPRSLPCLTDDPNVSDTARDRLDCPPIAQAPYRATARLAPGENRTLPVYAAVRWNHTGLFLEAGRQYTFTAAGEWLDGGTACGPEGIVNTPFDLGDIVRGLGTVIGAAENALNSLKGELNMDAPGSRRIETEPWFKLLGVVANGYHDTLGQRVPHEVIPIGRGAVFTPARSGYLYAFANDAWQFYWNNRGSVRLTLAA